MSISDEIIMHGAVREAAVALALELVEALMDREAPKVEDIFNQYLNPVGWKLAPLLAPA